ncbi:MAG: hypothetical protein RL260_2447 [Pseudomonadota bacterium]|jgi:hypothetical protein
MMQSPHLTYPAVTVQFNGMPTVNAGAFHPTHGNYPAAHTAHDAVGTWVPEDPTRIWVTTYTTEDTLVIVLRRNE